MSKLRRERADASRGAINWTRPNDLKGQMNRLWERGELLRSLVSGEQYFPLRLMLKGPGSAELAERFEAVRAWIAELVAAAHIRIEWREVNHRVLGLQRVPQSIWVDTLDDALALIKKQREADQFAELRALTRSRRPELEAWLSKRPLQAVGLAPQWPALLDVVDWLVSHPRPEIYLRQVDVPGVHSKVIEAHKAVLAELFDLALPAQAVDSRYGGAAQFCARYGFLDKPTRVRFRVLDERMALLPGPALPDVTLDAASFAKLNVPVRRVFITENETNFLAFPPVADAIVVFGAGYGWEALAQAKWLARCAIYYWGDIDTHGFAILDQLRARFEHVESFLMDRATLMAHQSLWGEEADPVTHDLTRLTATERELFDDLRHDRIRKGLRLEQERVGFRWVIEAFGGTECSDLWPDVDTD